MSINAVCKREMFYRRVERFFEQFEDALDRLGALRIANFVLTPPADELKIILEIDSAERGPAINFMQLRLYDSIARLRSVCNASKDCNRSRR
jgi:hypothetical protein